MKMLKSLISLLLILSFCFTALISCTKDDVKDEIDNADSIIDISKHTIVRPDRVSNEIKNTVSNFKKLLFSFTGAELTILSDWYNPTKPQDFESNLEILVGKTNRALETEAAAELDAVEDENSFIIKATDKKIAILGKNDEVTKRALKYFLVNYAKTTESGSKKVNLKNGHSEIKTVDTDSIFLSNFTELSIEERSTVVAPPEGHKGVYPYPTMITLAHNGEQNGTLIFAFESGAKIYRSTDDGATWEQISQVKDTLNEGYVINWMPFLYELPCDIGEYKAGTILFASTSREKSGNYFEITKITLHASTDCGMTWETICNVDEAGGLSWGVWEPFLIFDEGTERLYCFYSDDSDPAHSQKLVYKYTTDMVNWSELKECVACDDPKLRPGMISIAKMDNGEYAMAFELVGTYDDIYIKKTKDLDDWGDVSDYGEPVKTADGVGIGSAPWCAWTPAGGENGMLVVAARHEMPYQQAGYDGSPLLISFDYGETYIAIDDPIPHKVDLWADCRCGYSPCLYFSEDGKTLYYMNNPFPEGNEDCQCIELVKISISSIYD